MPSARPRELLRSAPTRRSRRWRRDASAAALEEAERWRVRGRASSTWRQARRAPAPARAALQPTAASTSALRHGGQGGGGVREHVVARDQEAGRGADGRRRRSSSPGLADELAAAEPVIGTDLADSRRTAQPANSSKCFAPRCSHGPTPLAARPPAPGTPMDLDTRRGERPLSFTEDPLVATTSSLLVVEAATPPPGRAGPRPPSIVRRPRRRRPARSTSAHRPSR